MTDSADLASCESADIKRRILELIEDASSIAISGHTSPDGDALGSVLGLGLSLMKVFPFRASTVLWRALICWCRHLPTPATRTCSFR